MNQIEITNTSLIGITGFAGCGKSYLANHLIPLMKPNRLVIYDPLNQYTKFAIPIVYNPEQAINAIRNKRSYRCCMADSDFVRQFIFNDVYEHGNTLLVIDECETVVGENKFEIPLALKNICCYRRHLGIGCILLSHRAIDIPNIFRSQCCLFFSEVKDWNDKKYLKQRIGQDAPSLPQYVFGVSPQFGGKTFLYKAP